MINIMYTTQHIHQQIALHPPFLTDETFQTIISQNKQSRKAGIRIQSEQVGDKKIFHNYGHKKASQAFGSAYFSVRSFYRQLLIDQRYECAVLGNQILGLFTALQLLQLGHKVTIYQDPQVQNSSFSSDQKIFDILPVFSFKQNRKNIDEKQSLEHYNHCLKQKRYKSLQMVYTYHKQEYSEQRTLKSSFQDRVKVSMGNELRETYIRSQSLIIDLAKFKEQLTKQALLLGAIIKEKTFPILSDVLNLQQLYIFNCLSNPLFLFVPENEQYIQTKYHIQFKNICPLNYSLTCSLQHKKTHILCIGNSTILQYESEKSAQQLIPLLIQQIQTYFQNRTLRPKL